jgi:hypothetical protein
VAGRRDLPGRGGVGEQPGQPPHRRGER